MGSVDFPLKGKIRCGNCRRVLGYDYKQASPIFWCREGMELIGQTQCSSEIYQASDIENAVFQALKKNFLYWTHSIVILKGRTELKRSQ